MTIIIGFIALGILVFFHESGHFIAARLCKVDVEAFSIGMGPVLLHKKIGSVDYRLSLLPFGGYCAMRGENDLKNAIENSSAIISNDKKTFYGAHPLKRLLIAFAGPFINLLLAFVFFTFVAFIGYDYYTAGTKVNMADEVYENMTSSAHQAGLESGDEIIAINGKSVSSFNEIAEIVTFSADEDISVDVLREGKKLNYKVSVLLDKDSGAGKIGIVSDTSSLIKKHYGSDSLGKAICEGTIETGKVLLWTFKGVGLLFKGINITKALSGPVRISSLMGDTVKTGYSKGVIKGTVSTLQILAIISISLFFTNILPLPVLDGGLILFSFVEWISRKKLNPKFLMYIQYAGIVILVMLMLFAFFCDFMFFINK